MTLLTFKAAEVEPIARHALAATAWRPSYADPEGEPAGPALWLVGDQGIYLMSNADPIDWIVPGQQARVAYAKGCDPETDDFDHWWELKRKLGQGDFVERLTWCQDMLDAIASGRQTIAIEVTRKQIRFA